MVEQLDLNRLKSPHTLITLGTAGLILLILSFIIKVRIILEYPAYGNITGIVRTFWSLILGIATVGSFALAVHNYRRDNNSNGPPTQFSVQGRNHDIDFNVYIGEPDESSEPAQLQEEGEEDDEETRPDSSSEDEEEGASEVH